jgi:DNA recombination protein RmuC
MAVLTEHLDDIGQSLAKSVQAYNKAVGSIETRVLPAARKFKELGIASDKDMAQLEPIDSVPRSAPPTE